MKKVSRRELARTITRQLLDGRDGQALMRQTAAYLIEHGMAAQAEMLIRDIAIELQQETGHVSGTIVSAFAPSSATLEQLKSYIKEATGAKSLEVSVVQDKTLLGGVVIQTPERQLDASVRRKLDQLAVERSA